MAAWEEAAMKVAPFSLLLCATLTAFTLRAQQGGIGTLAGTVVNGNGRPVVGASVTMESASGGSPHATTTNAQGRFFFPELIHGYYDVRASHNGLSSDWKHNIEVHTGKQTDVTLRLLHAEKKQQ
jgi:Carboxypeptidase regulatory-like domain